MRFAEGRGGVPTRDEIRLDTFASTQEETQIGHDGVKDIAGDFNLCFVSSVLRSKVK